MSNTAKAGKNIDPRLDVADMGYETIEKNTPVYDLTHLSLAIYCFIVIAGLFISNICEKIDFHCHYITGKSAILDLFI